MKKLLTVLATALLILGFTSCDQDPDHEHSFATEWTSDETDHWHAATCEHSDEVSEKEAHSFGDWTVTIEATEDADGTKTRECSVCSYKETATIDKLTHTHTFATTWSSDEKSHWHAATCKHTDEVSDKADHTLADYTVDGITGKKCSVCGYSNIKTVETPTFEFSVEGSSLTVSISCSTEGAKLYYTTDGTTPTSSSTEYSSTITNADQLTIKVIAVKEGMVTSTVATFKAVKVTYSTTYGSAASIILNKGTALTKEDLPELTDEKYNLDGWYVGETKVEAGYKVVEDVTLTAKWSKKTAYITVTVVSEDDPLTNNDEKVNVTAVQRSDNNNYVLLTAPAGYNEYQWTFMGITTTQTKQYTWSTPEQFEISFYPYKDGTYVAYLYIPDGSSTGKSATIYFDVNRQ